MTQISMSINGQAVSHDADSRTLLVEFIREHAGLTGTHQGCDTSQCGACVVHVNGRAVKSCTLFAVQAEGADVTTIEGLGSPDNLHPMQAAFRENHALQCGYCTPGMVMSAVALVADNPSPTREDIQHGLEGNICRCTGYQNIIDAVLDGANGMKTGG